MMDRQSQSTNQGVPPQCEGHEIPSQGQMPKMEKGDYQMQREGHEIPSRPQGQMPRMEKSDYQLLSENLKANMQFFRLGKVKMKHCIRA